MSKRKSTGLPNRDLGLHGSGKGCRPRNCFSGEFRRNFDEIQWRPITEDSKPKFRLIPLTQGKVAIVNEDVFEWASKFNWYADKRGNIFYARRDEGKDRIYMHREIFPGVKQIDHINGDGLDNRRENLRPATRRQNSYNSRKRSGASSEYKGVHWYSARKKWQAYIKTAERLVHLGYFNSEKKAARAYDEAAKKYFGEFARLNFP